MAVVFSNGISAIFLNGLLDNSAPLNLTNSTTGSLLIGKDSNPPAHSIRTFYGVLDDMRIYNRALSPSEVQQLFLFEAPTMLNIKKAVYLASPNLKVGTNYQVQVSSDLTNWTNFGTSFTATNGNWRTDYYWDVDDWGQLLFRFVSP